MRHAAVGFATGQRARKSSDPSVTADEMADAVSFVEDALHRGGYEAEMEAADAAFEARRAARENAPAPGKEAGRADADGQGASPGPVGGRSSSHATQPGRRAA